MGSMELGCRAFSGQNLYKFDRDPREMPTFEVSRGAFQTSKHIPDSPLDHFNLSHGQHSFHFFSRGRSLWCAASRIVVQRNGGLPNCTALAVSPLAVLQAGSRLGSGARGPSWPVGTALQREVVGGRLRRPPTAVGGRRDRPPTTGSRVACHCGGTKAVASPPGTTGCPWERCFPR